MRRQCHASNHVPRVMSTARGSCLQRQVILDGARVKPGAIAAFVELHIEQGPLLERDGVQLGIVSAIAAPAALRVFFSGDGGHAGALLMPDRYVPELSQQNSMARVCNLRKRFSSNVGTSWALCSPSLRPLLLLELT